MTRFKAFRPLDLRGVEILDEFERRWGIKPEQRDVDGTRWYDPEKFKTKERPTAPIPNEFKHDKGAFQVLK